MNYTKEMKIKDNANAMVDRYDLDGAIQVAQNTWKKYLGSEDIVHKDMCDLYSEIWWYLVERADGKTLAKLFTTDTLCQIALAKSMRSLKKESK